MERDDIIKNIITGEKDFNSHAHVERDVELLMYGEVQPHFNSHAHVERDALPQTLASPQTHFNSHAHVERDCVKILQ